MNFHLYVRSTGFSLLLSHMVALINSLNTGWQRVRSATGDEWHFSEHNGEQWVSGVSCGVATYVHIKVHSNLIFQPYVIVHR